MTPMGGDKQQTTTVVIRKIAHKMNQDSVKEVLDKAGFSGKFAFVYTPYILARGDNVGYTFVGFRQLEFARECYAAFHGKGFGDSTKPCRVEFAKMQGNLQSILNKRRRKQQGECPDILICDDSGNVVDVKDMDSPMPMTPQKFCKANKAFPRSIPPPSPPLEQNQSAAVAAPMPSPSGARTFGGNPTQPRMAFSSARSPPAAKDQRAEVGASMPSPSGAPSAARTFGGFPVPPDMTFLLARSPTSEPNQQAAGGAAAQLPPGALPRGGFAGSNVAPWIAGRYVSANQLPAVLAAAAIRGAGPFDDAERKVWVMSF